MSYAVAFIHAPYISAHCPIPCGHSADIPLDALIARVGPDLETDQLCRRLRCTKCGHRGATITLPSKSTRDQPWHPLRSDAIPNWAKKDTLYPIEDPQAIANEKKG